jgi:hypothetical protein
MDQIIVIKKWSFFNHHQCMDEQVKNFLMDGQMHIIIIIIKTLKFSINVVFVSEQCREEKQKLLNK